MQVSAFLHIRYTGAMISFKEKVFAIVKKIPRGSVLTYKQVAITAGRPHAARAVGNILNTNYDPTIPCHRVIRSDGRAGGYNRGAKNKRNILRKEGVQTMLK